MGKISASQQKLYDAIIKLGRLLTEEEIVDFYVSHHSKGTCYRMRTFRGERMFENSYAAVKTKALLCYTYALGKLVINGLLPLKKTVFWCTTHKREAKSFDNRGIPCCSPNWGGILAPCNVVFKDHKQLDTVTLPTGETMSKNLALSKIILNLQADLDFNEYCHRKDGNIPDGSTDVIPRSWISRDTLKNWIAVLDSFLE